MRGPGPGDTPASGSPLAALAEDARRTAEPAQALFGVFALLMAFATLFHQAQLGDWKPLSHHTAVSLSALWLMLRPSSPARFLLSSAAQLISWALDMPRVVNHWMMLGLSNICLLGCLPLLASSRREQAGAAALYDWLAPLLRIHLVLVYGFATLAKINAAFLDPRMSCAVAMYGDVTRELPFLPRGDWTAGPAIWGTMFIEAGLAVLLAFSRTRVAALLVGGAFHTLLAVAGHVPFSGFALALYVLFLPDDFPARLRRFREEHPWPVRVAERVASWARSRPAFPVLAGMWLLAACVLTFGSVSGPTEKALLQHALLALFLLLTAGLAVILVLCLGQDAPLVHRPGAFRVRHPVCLAGPFLVVLNGLCPYLGLKTQSSFTMYSNLQTEGDQWNHAWLPKAMRIFSFQDDLVRIVSSSDPRLGRSAREGTRWVYFQFHEYLSGRPHASVTYERHGRREAVARVAEHPVLSKPPSLTLRKLLWFREVPRPEWNACRH